MVFSSLFFLFYFLPITVFIYFLVKSKYRNLVLLIASLCFYAWGEPIYVWIMLFSTVLDYSAGRGIHWSQSIDKANWAKFFLGLSVVGNLSLLVFFKYSNFLIGNLNSLGMNLNLLSLSLPIGISFYTFQTMSYSIDVYRGDTKVQMNILNFATYVTLFPQLIAGPIVRYQTVAEEIDKRQESYEMVSSGIEKFIIGLAKKVLLANNIGVLWQKISNGQIEMSIIASWLGIIAFAFQIYFDFSGYSDMAIGLGRIFGFNFLENFNYPYMARSITDFWRRWHISLGTWFREYLYIPLGGNRGGFWKHICNLFIVWLLTGIWHGAAWNYIFWGIYFALLLVIEKYVLLKYLVRIPLWVSHIYALFFILISWVFFAHDSLGQAFHYLRSMLDPRGLAFINNDLLYLLRSNAFLLSVLVLASTDYPLKFVRKYVYKSSIREIILTNSYLIIIFIITIAFLVNSSFNPFLYFKF